MADVQVKYTSDMQKLLRDQDKQLQKHEQTIKKLQDTVRAAKNAGDSFDRAGKKGQQSLGTQLAGKLTATATNLFALDRAARLVGDAMRFVKEETDKAMRSFEGLDDVRRSLAQIATGPGDLQRLETQADTLAARYGVDRNTVRQVLFSARSEGFEQFAPDIIRFAPVVAPTAAAAAAGQLPGLFPGAGLGPREAVNAALTAARVSRLNFEQLGRALPGAAEGAGAAGASPAETFAIAATLASRFKSGETAADRIKAFGIKVSLDDELRGKGLVEAVRVLQKSSEERRSKFLGESAELNSAFRVIGEEMSTIVERQRQIAESIAAAGTGRSALEQGLAARLTPTTPQGRAELASQRARQAAIGREIANETALATGGFGAQAAIDREQQRMLRLGRSGLSRFGASTAAQAAQLVTQNERAVTIASRIGGESLLNPLGIVTMFREAVKSFEQATRQLNTNQRPNNKPAARQVPSLATE